MMVMVRTMENGPDLGGRRFAFEHVQETYSIGRWKFSVQRNTTNFVLQFSLKSLQQVESFSRDLFIGTYIFVTMYE